LGDDIIHVQRGVFCGVFDKHMNSFAQASNESVISYDLDDWQSGVSW